MASKKKVFSLFISIVMIIVMIPVNVLADSGYARILEYVIDEDCSEISVQIEIICPNIGINDLEFIVNNGATRSVISRGDGDYYTYDITITAKEGVTFKDNPVTLSIVTPHFLDIMISVNGKDIHYFVRTESQISIDGQFATHAVISAIELDRVSSCVVDDLLVNFKTDLWVDYIDDSGRYQKGWGSILDIGVDGNRDFLGVRTCDVDIAYDNSIDGCNHAFNVYQIANITYDYCGFPVDENTKDEDFMQLLINQGSRDLNEADFTALREYLIKNYDSNNDEIISFTEAIKVKEIHLTGITGAGDRYCDSKGVYHYIDNEYASTNYCKKPVYDLFPNLEKFSYSFPAELYSEEGVAGFVERLYVYVLERDSDPLGKLSWVTAAENGATGADLATGFLFSEEFLNKPYRYDDFVKILYRVFFDRSADALGLNGWVEALEAGMSKTEVVAGFINSTEWANMCLSYGIKPGGIGDATIEIDPSDEIGQFVNRLYENCLGRQPDEEGFSRWKSDLANMRITGAQAALGFVFSPEFINSGFSNEEYITILYNTFLDREPSSLELSGWVTSLNSGETREKVLDGFIYSIEFGRICNQYGIAIY